MLEKLNNIVYDTDYTKFITGGGFVSLQKSQDSQS